MPISYPSIAWNLPLVFSGCLPRMEGSRHGDAGATEDGATEDGVTGDGATGDGVDWALPEDG